MADQNLHESIEVSSTPQGSKHEVSLIKVEGQILLLTWITFFILLAILWKFAWKPILQSLDEREAKIRRAVDEAEQTRAEYEKIEATRKKLITEAQDKAKEIVEQSRKAAINAAKTIEQKTKEQADILLENAQREIKSEQEKAVAVLKEESAKIAVALASKILEENLDTERNQKLVNRLIKEIGS